MRLQSTPRIGGGSAFYVRRHYTQQPQDILWNKTNQIVRVQDFHCAQALAIGIGSGVGVGAGVGTAVGVATHDLGIGIGVGVGVGMAIAFAFCGKRCAKA